MASYPKDRFDELPDDLTRVGAHRAPKRKGSAWIGFAWALLATGVLIFGGLFAISRVFDIDLGLPIFAQQSTPTPTPTPTPTMDPVLDPLAPEFVARGLKVIVLNGTMTSGLQTTVGADLTAKGWVVASAIPAGSRDVEETLVYYSDPANEDAARGIVVALGLGDIRLVPPETFPGAPITVVLGADFPGAAPLAPEPETTP
jgi:hypothetical protein